MKRGDLITIAVAGDYGKPRPALVVQANVFEALPSITVLPLTSALHDTPLLRITIEPTASNGLHLISQVMIDKITTIPAAKAGSSFGRLGEPAMANISRALAAFLALG